MSTQHTTTDKPTGQETETTPPDAAAAESQTDALEADDVFHLLQNQRRRLALRYLRDAEEDTVRMRDLAEQVAAWEHDTTVALLSSRERQRVYIPLYQNHLPKLAKQGVIDYQQSRGVVTRLDAADQLDPYLPTVSDEEPAGGRSWPMYYLATALAGMGVLGAAWTDVSVFSAVPDAVAGAVVVAAVALVAFTQAVAERSAPSP